MKKIPICSKCSRDEHGCMTGRYYMQCPKWRKWFRDKWSEIQKNCGVDVSERHNEEESDDK